MDISESNLNFLLCYGLQDYRLCVQSQRRQSNDTGNTGRGACLLPIGSYQVVEDCNTCNISCKNLLLLLNVDIMNEDQDPVRLFGADCLLNLRFNLIGPIKTLSR